MCLFALYDIYDLAIASKIKMGLIQNKITACRNLGNLAQKFQRDFG